MVGRVEWKVEEGSERKWSGVEWRPEGGVEGYRSENVEVGKPSVELEWRR